MSSPETPEGAPPRRVTITDIARETGFSESTVSLVLNNSPRIKDETRSKILATIEKRGYRPNTQARSLALQSSGVISVVVPDIPHVFADNYFGELISGIYAHATEAGFKLLLDIANLKFIRTQEYAGLLSSQRADAMLFLGASLYDQYLTHFSGKRAPFLLVNSYFPDAPVNHVSADYRATARLAAEHLLGLGHRAIGIIGGTNIQTAVDFRETFEAALREAGLSPENMPWTDGRFAEEMAFEAARVLLTMSPHLTAVMCGNDKMALGTVRYIRSKGLRVPEDISVMGVDDGYHGIVITPRLTTVSHHLYQIGSEACRLGLSLARGEIQSCHTSMPVDLVVGETTGPARKH
jgi:DNA-binding LacI/PurR family transcriptional regulator